MTVRYRVTSKLFQLHNPIRVFIPKLKLHWLTLLLHIWKDSGSNLALHTA